MGKWERGEEKTAVEGGREGGVEEGSCHATHSCVARPKFAPKGEEAQLFPFF